MKKYIFGALLGVVLGVASVGVMATLSPEKDAVKEPPQHTVSAVSFSICGFVQYIVITIDGKTYLIRDRDLDDNPDMVAFVKQIMEIMQVQHVVVTKVALDQDLRLYGIKCTSV